MGSISTVGPRPSLEPTVTNERVVALDAVRGFALLGVLIANLVLFSISNNISTDAQQALMFADYDNRATLFLVLWLIDDKASTLFAVLFGAGFWLQLSRLRDSDASAVRVYLRRLLVLLLFGLANLLLIWPWDILQQYALVGLILLTMRGISTKLAVSLGVGLSLAGKPLINWLCESLGLRQAANARVYSVEAIAQRQEAYIQGDYLDWLHETSTLVWNDYLLSGAILGWAAYVLGRFLLGMVLMRENTIERLSEDPKLLAQATALLTALGLSLEAFRSASQLGFLETPEWVGVVGQAVGAPALGLAYAAWILLALRSNIGEVVFRPFMAVGQMALTNYLAQGAFIGLLLFGHGPGLALAGQLSPKAAALAAIGFFGFQLLISPLWLKHFQRGPIEAVWRRWTYGW